MGSPNLFGFTVSSSTCLSWELFGQELGTNDNRKIRYVFTVSSVKTQILLLPDLFCNYLPCVSVTSCPTSQLVSPVPNHLDLPCVFSLCFFMPLFLFSVFCLFTSVPVSFWTSSLGLLVFGCLVAVGISSDYKHSVRLKDELIIFLWSKVKGHGCNSRIMSKTIWRKFFSMAHIHQLTSLCMQLMNTNTPEGLIW